MFLGILGIICMFPWFFFILFLLILGVIFSEDPKKVQAKREKAERETDFLRAWAVKKVQEEDSKPTLDEFLARMRKRG